MTRLVRQHPNFRSDVKSPSETVQGFAIAIKDLPLFIRSPFKSDSNVYNVVIKFRVLSGTQVGFDYKSGDLIHHKCNQIKSLVLRGRQRLMLFQVPTESDPVSVIPYDGLNLRKPTSNFLSNKSQLYGHYSGRQGTC